MKLNKELINFGYKLSKVYKDNLTEFLEIKKEINKDYVEKFFGGWNDKEQAEYNTKVFKESLNQTLFKSIYFENKLVGFIGYTLYEDKIGCITMQLLDLKMRYDFILWYFKELIKLSKKEEKPIYLKCFKTSKDNEILKLLNFQLINETTSHNLYIYNV